MARREENNFKKAMNELLGAAVKEPTATVVREEMAEPVVTNIAVEEPVKEEKSAEDVVYALGEERVFVKPETFGARTEAVIPHDMVINGNITTKSNMNIAGSVVGDILCEGNIFLQGTVQGNVNAGNITIQNGNLQGDVAVQENAIIEQGSNLKGNLSAQNVYTNAYTEGKINAGGMVELKSQAYVKGDVTAKLFTVSAGAKIKGMVSIDE